GDRWDKTMKWHAVDIDELERKLHVFHKKGLLKKQVEERVKRYGENKLQEDEKQSLFVLWMKQIQDYLVLILFAATLIASLLGEFIDRTAILLIVLLNGMVGFFQEKKAENSLAQLKALSAPETRVLRDGKWQTIPSKDLVIGDVVTMKAGDRVPADIRLIEANALQIEEAILTGESAPVNKQTNTIRYAADDIHDHTNIAFKSTLIRK